MRLEPLYSFTASLRPRQIGVTPGGARLDVEFEGDLDPGGRLTGHLRAINYLTVRSDGVAHVHVRGTVTTPEGEVVAFTATGLTVPAPDGSATVRDAVTYQTGASNLAWLNATVGFAAGNADLTKGELRLSVHTLED